MKIMHKRIMIDVVLHAPDYHKQDTYRLQASLQTSDHNPHNGDANPWSQ